MATYTVCPLNSFYSLILLTLHSNSQTAEPSIGELRFIARLKSNLLTTSAFPQSYSGSGTAGAVEGSDVYKDGSGYTYSKFYSSVRFIEDKCHWVATSGLDVHVTMVCATYSQVLVS